MESGERNDNRRVSRWSSAVAGVVLVAWLIAVGRLVIPDHEVCIMIYPAPPGCGGDGRDQAALITAAIMVALTAAQTWLAWKRRMVAWIPWTAAGLVTIAALVTYRAVLYA